MSPSAFHAMEALPAVQPFGQDRRACRRWPHGLRGMVPAACPPKSR
ncbi:hypothetical protein HY734_03760 [Candidatus Uhrbacteria bacterium]|nr:hypothetical protein [Candidatus Uhrbacteria bacterium]